MMLRKIWKKVNQSKYYNIMLFRTAMTKIEKIRSEHDPIQSFAGKLEERACKVVDDTIGRNGNISQSSIIEDDLALTLHQIDRLRARGQEIGQSLLQAECYIGTELMQMEQRTPRYSPYRFPEREKLQRRLGRIDEERRRFSTSHAEKMASLHDRLLSLLNKHWHLKPIKDQNLKRTKTNWANAV